MLLSSGKATPSTLGRFSRQELSGDLDVIRRDKHNNYSIQAKSRDFTD